MKRVDYMQVAEQAMNQIRVGAFLTVKAGEALTGHTAEAVSFGTEAPFFGQLGMETIVLGPGNIAQAHQPDEYLEVARIEPTLELLRALIRRFCLED